MSKIPVKKEQEVIPQEYKNFLGEIKKKILSSQLKAATAVNQELIKLYWEIGNKILEKQEKEGWGTKTIEKLSKDLKNLFPNMKGFSPRNLRYMVAFAREFSDFSIVQQLAAQIPWGHNMLLLDRVKDFDSRAWYIQKTIENGWSRSVLMTWIESNLYRRQGKATTNFKATLPKPQSDLANQTLKDPYCFEFLTLREKHDEKELEEGLLEHIQKFLLELGTGFAFVGKQYSIEVGKKNYYLDLLFYHLKLKCYCIIELKSKEFKPEDAGKMNFYLSAVDSLLKRPDDNPSIGIVLCKTKDKITAEYALRDIKKPIGISGYETKITESLPKNFKSSLPTVEDIENEFINPKEGEMIK